MIIKRRQFLKTATPAAIFASTSLSFAADMTRYPKEKPNGHFTLWQLPPQTHSQNMSYVLQSNGGKLMVIDGGTTGDAVYLRGFLAALGNRVHTWFVSHAHFDHYDALTAILNKPGKLKIDEIHASLPTENWIKENEPRSLARALAFNKAVKNSGHRVLELTIGQVLFLDEIRVEILAVKNPEIKYNGVNNSSVVMKVFMHDKTILFTGDLGIEGGQKLMESPQAKCLCADYVQMSHHGQNGVDEAFYKAVGAKYCFWPTPRWLWENNNGKGKGSGPWKTLVVRGWMDKLDIKKHYVSADGLYCIEM